MEVERRNFPNRLRMHRKLARYKQKQVTALLGLNATQLSKWENGVLMPNGINLIKLSIIYCTLPTELYFEYFQELKEQLKPKEWELFKG
jgi:transcriptional regulator with XRE-family HTH domain